jgi:hypothetical protein
LSDAPVSEIVGFRTATFIESGETREVVRDCKVCRSAPEVYGDGVLSPSGIAHIVAGYGDHTLCGKDATGESWWWPL